eukprot:COSAG04_NODE_6022_length_1430_cov_1.189331_1_plen_98_part_10
MLWRPDQPDSNSSVWTQLVSECYNYCGFSFFPALPWKAMEVPPSVPHPQMVMLAGLFEFGDVDTHFWTFVSSGLVVPASFALYYCTRRNKARNLLVIQ